jgi:two-component system, NarL family, response regulator NreC
MKLSIFDDHPVICEALSSFFSQREGVEIVGVATKNSEVLPLLESKSVDVLIADVLTDESLGLEIFEQIQAGKFETRVVVYTSLRSEVVYGFLYEYGVAAIVNKARGLNELWQVVEAAFMATKPQKEGKWQLPPALTTKEKEIVKYMARGFAAKEIALFTNSSINTINNQKNHLLAKFGCANTTELLAQLIQMGYVEI